MQLTAQALAALDGLEQLAHSLLLATRVPGAAHLFSGRTFHAALLAPEAPEVLEQLWEAVCAGGLEGEFAEEKEARGKKAKKARPPAPAGKKGGSAQGRSVFAMLGDADA